MKTNLKEGTVFLTFSSLIFIISGYLINIILGRYLGPASYGIYGILITIMTAINLTQTSGLPQAVTKFIAEDENKAETILKSGLIIQIVYTAIISLLFFLLAVPLANLFHDTSLIPYLQLVAGVFPLYGIYALYVCYYSGLHYFKTQAFMGIVYSLIKLLAVIILVYFFHVYGAIWGFIIAPFITLLFWLHFPKRIYHHFSYKKLILFSLPLIGIAIFSNLLQSIDLFFIKALLHSNQNTGFYMANQNIAEIPFYGAAALSSVLFPSISRHVSKQLTNETKNLINKSLRFSLIIIAPSVLLISATSLQALRLLYSSAYSPGATALAILAIGNGFFTLFVILTTIISGAGSPTKSSLLAGLGVLMSSLFCILLIPQFGLIGAALSTTLTAFIVMICAGIIVYRKFTVLMNTYSAIKIVVASFIIYLLAKIIVLPLLLLPFVYIFLFALYFEILFLFKEITPEDIVLVKSLMPKFLRRK